MFCPACGQSLIGYIDRASNLDLIPVYIHELTRIADLQEYEPTAPHSTMLQLNQGTMKRIQHAMPQCHPRNSFNHH